jgi:hypothetical protein
MHEWVTLTTRMGESIANPSQRQLRQALEDLFSSEDEEHPDCWIECGTQAGPLHSYSFFSSGRGVYTKYSDVDMDEELESKECVVNDPETALWQWEHLIIGEFEKL